MIQYQQFTQTEIDNSCFRTDSAQSSPATQLNLEIHVQTGPSRWQHSNRHEGTDNHKRAHKVSNKFKKFGAQRLEILKQF